MHESMRKNMIVPLSVSFVAVRLLHEKTLESNNEAKLFGTTSK